METRVKELNEGIEDIMDCHLFLPLTPTDLTHYQAISYASKSTKPTRKLLRSSGYITPQSSRTRPALLPISPSIGYATRKNSSHGYYSPRGAPVMVEYRQHHHQQPPLDHRNSLPIMTSVIHEGEVHTPKSTRKLSQSEDQGLRTRRSSLSEKFVNLKAHLQPSRTRSNNEFPQFQRSLC